MVHITQDFKTKLRFSCHWLKFNIVNGAELDKFGQDFTCGCLSVRQCASVTCFTRTCEKQLQAKLVFLCLNEARLSRTILCVDHLAKYLPSETLNEATALVTLSTSLVSDHMGEL